jgi:hypothetical protein
LLARKRRFYMAMGLRANSYTRREVKGHRSSVGVLLGLFLVNENRLVFEEDRDEKVSHSISGISVGAAHRSAVVRP